MRQLIFVLFSVLLAAVRINSQQGTKLYKYVCNSDLYGVHHLLFKSYSSKFGLNIARKTLLELQQKVHLIYLQIIHNQTSQENTK